ncbi:hypothetical protein OIU78_006013 [Salix suchowensis]|nr:hypothetical protein OIU78_006013 [Salix suchowensis]
METIIGVSAVLLCQKMMMVIVQCQDCWRLVRGLAGTMKIKLGGVESTLSSWVLVKGGKIPRRSSSSSGGVKGDKDFSRVENDKVLSESEERRRERRERAKLKKQVDKGKDKIEIVMKSKDGFVNRADGVRLEGSKPGRVDHQQDCRVENSSRFPGRESLLKKVLSRKNVL